MVGAEDFADISNYQTLSTDKNQRRYQPSTKLIKSGCIFVLVGVKVHSTHNSSVFHNTALLPIDTSRKDACFFNVMGLSSKNQHSPQSKAKAKTQCVKHCEIEEYRVLNTFSLCTANVVCKGFRQDEVQVMECRVPSENFGRIDVWSWWVNLVQRG